MTGSFTSAGILWACLSVTAALLSCSGFYLPYWIQGSLLGKVDASFSTFRRCNYPHLTPQGSVEIVIQCARYSSFKDIPSPWWQISTVFVASGSALSLIVAVVIVAACCMASVIHRRTARVAGVVQLLSALLICGGVGVYPLGWDNKEVRDCCGKGADIYRLGTCQLSWSLYLLVGAVVLLFISFCLSFCGARVKPG
uniref:LHFPL tetraspan subfamily member 6 protein n=1 Tax=Clastoptera arizonana TaxID=38151 RepID=A0A1B6EFG9_9HEMI